MGILSPSAHSLQIAFVILSDFVNRKTHTLKVRLEAQLNSTTGSGPVQGSFPSPEPSPEPSSTSTTNNDLVMEDIDSNENILNH